MLFPKDKPLHVNLDTSFVLFPALLEYLAEKRFSGCLRMEFADFEGTLFFSAGELLDCGTREGNVDRSGQEARASMEQRAATRGGRVDTFALNPDLVRLLGELVGSEPIYRDLSTEFANPDRLIARLKDQGHTGYIEVALGDGRGEGVIFLRAGEFVDAVLESESQTYSGLPVIDSIVQGAANLGAIFNVYRAAGSAVAAARPPAAPAQAAMPAPTPTVVPFAPAPVHRGALPMPPPPHTMAAVLAGQPLAGPGGPAAAEPRPIGAQPERVSPAGIEMLDFWSEMLSKAEAAVDRLSQDGRFATAFKEVLVEKAASFPYLDPFAAEFEYREGRATYSGEPPVDLPEALGDCLHDTIARLAFRLKRADLETRVRAELSEMYSEHQAMIDHFSPSTQALVS